MIRFLFVFFILLLTCSCKADTISKCLESIPKKDLIRIDHLFRYLMLDGQFIYTLSGSKPMSTIGYRKDFQIYGFFYPMLMNQIKINWKTWEKYSHLFPSFSFAFFAQEHEDWFEIYLINKKLLQNTIKKNLNIFIQKLSLSDTSQIFDHILKSKRLYKDGIHQSQAIYGILLGYGAENSLGFEDLYSRGYKFLLSSPTQIEREKFPYQLDLPYFISFSKRETAQLYETYKKDREYIVKEFDSNLSFLEIILEKLTAEKGLKKIGPYQQ